MTLLFIQTFIQLNSLEINFDNNHPKIQMYLWDLLQTLVICYKLLNITDPVFLHV